MYRNVERIVRRVYPQTLLNTRMETLPPLQPEA